MTPNEKPSAIRPLHPGSALLLAAGDWLALALNIETGMEAYWPVAVGCASLATLGIAAVENKVAHDTLRAALIKAVLLSGLIVLPFPVAGSVAALGLLIWWCASYFHRRKHAADGLPRVQP